MAGPRKEGKLESFEFPSSSPEIIEALGFEELSERIKSVRLLDESIKGLRPYRKSVVTLEKVKIADLHPCAKYVLNQNLEIQAELRKQFLRQGIDTLNMPYDKAFIHYKWGGVENVMIPPLVEISEDDDNTPIVTDGLHRVTMAKMDGLEEITAAVVRNTAVPLAVLPVSWEEVKRFDSVPSAKEKRNMRFEPSAEMFKWFGLNKRNIQRLIGGFEDFSGYSYKALFRDLNIGSYRVEVRDVSKNETDFENFKPWWEELKTKCMQEYTSAGFIVTDKEGKQILLGSHHEAPTLWGPIAGRRELWEMDPKVTATREFKEELDFPINSRVDLGDPLIIIDKHHGKERPSIGILYHIKVDRRKKIKIPSDSEIKELKWYDGGTSLMDEHNPLQNLWGGTLTATVLQCFDRYKNGEWLPVAGFDRFAPWDFPGMDVSLSGVMEVNIVSDSDLFNSPYHKIRAREKSSLV